MTKEIEELIDESIKLEDNVGALYNLFSKLYPEDRDFWWQLYMEESAHAVILQDAKETFIPAGVFSDKIIYKELNELKKSNEEILKKIQEYEQNKPSKEEIVNLAITLEESAGEAHFQMLTDTPSDERGVKIFQKLADGDRDHAQRIKKYFKIL